jgi:hypothetical protein
MVRAQPPPQEPRTSLWSLAFKMQTIASKFLSIYNDVKDVWLLGKHLSYPFYMMYVYIMTGAGYVFEADNKLVHILTWLKGIIEGNTLVQLIASFSWDLQQIINNPLGWFIAKLGESSHNFRRIREDPYQFVMDMLFARLPIIRDIIYRTSDWLKDKLRDISHDLFLFIENPWQYLYDKMTSMFTWLYWINAEPVNTVINWLVNYSWWFRDFLNNPQDKIISFIIQARPEMNDLLNNPYYWIKRKISDVLGIDLNSGEPTGLVMFFHIIDTLVYMPQHILDRVASKLVDFILRFI